MELTNKGNERCLLHSVSSNAREASLFSFDERRIGSGGTKVKARRLGKETEVAVFGAVSCG